MHQIQAVTRIKRETKHTETIRSELATIRAHIDAGLLDDIARDLAALRTQMGKGVFGLLGI